MAALTEYQKIMRQITKLYDKIFALRATCTHPNAIGTYVVDLTTLASIEDKHWLDIVCPDCGKRWVLGNDHPDYLSFSRIDNHKISE